MGGISHKTGQPISNLESALESVEVIFSTRIMSRVMRRQFCGGIVELLGKLVTPRLFSAFQTLVVASIDVWEPRFRVRQVHFSGNVDQIRLGKASFGVEVDYRPRALSGDFTTERVLTLNVGFVRGVLSVTA